METLQIRKYGVTEKKKSELDALLIEVRNAQDEVAQYDAVLTSLTQKLDQFNNELVIAKANKEQGLANKNLMDDIVLGAQDLTSDSSIVLTRMQTSEGIIKDAASKMSTLIDELIYTAELINKLSDLIVRKKEVNPLISDELIKKVTQAGTDANNAVALTLTALQSIFTSQATNIEGQNVLKLENKFALELNGLIKYLQKDSSILDDVEAFQLTDSIEDFMNISDMLLKAYHDYEAIYNSTLIATEDTKKQLTEAKLEYDNAVVNLNALTASLAAAQAAALAS